jgi:hypothetical protein
LSLYSSYIEYLFIRYNNKKILDSEMKGLDNEMKELDSTVTKLDNEMKGLDSTARKLKRPR